MRRKGILMSKQFLLLIEMAEMIQITTVSSKGQVVLPSELRHKLQLVAGSRLAAFAEGDTLFLKKIRLPDAAEFKRLATEGRKIAEKHGLRQEDVEEIIHEHRKK